jgi:hypothetical protein
MQFETGARPDALTVPLGAVTRLGGKARIWVVRGGRAEPRDVVTGLEDPERIEVTHGLRGDETVVARGHEGLYAGAPVRDVSAPTAGPRHETHTGMPGMKGEERHRPATPAPMSPDIPMTREAPPAPETSHGGH